MKRGNQRRRELATKDFEEASKLACEKGLTLRPLAYADDPEDVTQYRIDGPDGLWYKDIYPGPQRIYCPDKKKQGPFISMKLGQRWSLVDIVKACVIAMAREPNNPRPKEDREPEVTGDATDTRELLVQLISAISKTEGATTQASMRDLVTDLRHVSDHLKLDLEEALKGSYEVYLEEKADPEFKFGEDP